MSVVRIKELEDRLRQVADAVAEFRALHENSWPHGQRIHLRQIEGIARGRPQEEEPKPDFSIESFPSCCTYHSTGGAREFSCGPVVFRGTPR